MNKEEFLLAVENKNNKHFVTKNGVLYHLRDGTNWRDGGESFICWYGSERYSDIAAVGTFRTRGFSTTITLGSDPEFFYLNKGRVVPSKFVVGNAKYVSEDGFQAELHPATNTCRQVAGNNIYLALAEAKKLAVNGAEVALSVGVDVDTETFKLLPPNERRFGCSPTVNLYENKKRITGVREKFRSGAGHIHLGSSRLKSLYESNPVKVIALLDIVCGALCVLIDRDPANITRRKHYGRAGEHRVKSYGLEYRVPSNFWLRSYTLWSMVSGLARNALAYAEDELGDELMRKINLQDVRKAINNNDKELAMKIAKQYAEFIKENNIMFSTGLNLVNVDKFLEWAATDNPIDALNVPDFRATMRNWENHYIDAAVPGFERFLADY